MPSIEVKITIPDHEYEQWNGFEDDGVNGVKAELLQDFSSVCRALYIKNADIEINFNE